MDPMLLHSGSLKRGTFYQLFFSSAFNNRHAHTWHYRNPGVALDPVANGKMTSTRKETPQDDMRKEKKGTPSSSGKHQFKNFTLYSTGVNE